MAVCERDSEGESWVGMLSVTDLEDDSVPLVPLRGFRRRVKVEVCVRCVIPRNLDLMRTRRPWH